MPKLHLPVTIVIPSCINGGTVITLIHQPDSIFSCIHPRQGVGYWKTISFASETFNKASKKKIFSSGLYKVMLGLSAGVERQGTAGSSEWMDVPLGKLPDVTADLIRMAFYPADEHVACAASASLTSLRRFIMSVALNKSCALGRSMIKKRLIKLLICTIKLVLLYYYL